MKFYTSLAFWTLIIMQGQLLQVAPYLKEKRQLTQLFWGEKRNKTKPTALKMQVSPSQVQSPTSSVDFLFTCHCYLSPQDSKTRDAFCRPGLLKIRGLAQPEPVCLAWFILSWRHHNNEFPLLLCSYLLTDMGGAPYAQSHTMACHAFGTVSNALSFQRRISLHLLVFLCL